MKYKSAYEKYEQELSEVCEYNNQIENELKKELNLILKRKGLKEHIHHL